MTSFLSQVGDTFLLQVFVPTSEITLSFSPCSSLRCFSPKGPTKVCLRREAKNLCVLCFLWLLNSFPNFLYFWTPIFRNNLNIANNVVIFTPYNKYVAKQQRLLCVSDLVKAQNHSFVVWNMFVSLADRYIFFAFFHIAVIVGLCQRHWGLCFLFYFYCLAEAEVFRLGHC